MRGSPRRGSRSHSSPARPERPRVSDPPAPSLPVVVAAPSPGRGTPPSRVWIDAVLGFAMGGLLAKLVLASVDSAYAASGIGVGDVLVMVIGLVSASMP